MNKVWKKWFFSFWNVLSNFIGFWITVEKLWHFLSTSFSSRFGSMLLKNENSVLKRRVQKIRDLLAFFPWENDRREIVCHATWLALPEIQKGDFNGILVYALNKTRNVFCNFFSKLSIHKRNWIIWFRFRKRAFIFFSYQTKTGQRSPRTNKQIPRERRLSFQDDGKPARTFLTSHRSILRKTSPGDNA